MRNHKIVYQPCIPTVRYLKGVYKPEKSHVVKGKVLEST